MILYLISALFAYFRHIEKDIQRTRMYEIAGGNRGVNETLYCYERNAYAAYDSSSFYVFILV